MNWHKPIFCTQAWALQNVVDSYTGLRFTQGKFVTCLFQMNTHCQLARVKNVAHNIL